MSAETEGTGRRTDVRARAPSRGVPAGRARAVQSRSGTRARNNRGEGRVLGARSRRGALPSARCTPTAPATLPRRRARLTGTQRRCLRDRLLCEHARVPAHACTCDHGFSPTRRVMTSCSRGCPRRHAGSACVALCSEGRVQGRWPRRRPGRRAARSPRGRDAAVAAAWGKHVPRFPRRRGDRAPALPPADVSAGGAPVTRQGVLRRKWMLTPSAHGERRPPQVQGSVPRTAPRTRASGAGRQSGLSPVLLTGDKSEAPAPPS